MQVTAECAAKPARAQIAAELDAAFGARATERRQREAKVAAQRLATNRAGKAAQLIAMPRMAALMKAGALLGSAKALAEALGIADRTLRAKTGAERGVTDEDLRSAADALDARIAGLSQHAHALRAMAAQSDGGKPAPTTPVGIAHEAIPSPVVAHAAQGPSSPELRGA